MPLIIAMPIGLAALLMGLINPDGGSTLVGERFELSPANKKGGTSTCVIRYLFV